MMKNTLIIIFMLISTVFGIYFFADRNLKIYDSFLLKTERECCGKFWITVKNEVQAKKVKIKYGIDLPENDYTNFYFIVSDGRAIKKIKYNLYSKYLWEYKIPKGETEFTDEFYEHYMICYRTEKRFLKQEGE